MTSDNVELKKQVYRLLEKNYNLVEKMSQFRKLHKEILELQEINHKGITRKHVLTSMMFTTIVVFFIGFCVGSFYKKIEVNDIYQEEVSTINQSGAESLAKYEVIPLETKNKQVKKTYRKHRIKKEKNNKTVSKKKFKVVKLDSDPLKTSGLRDAWD